MPGFNRKGPLGEGSATGGGRGLCNRPGQSIEGDKVVGSRSGCGLGRGRGAGRGEGAGAGVGNGRQQGCGRGLGRGIGGGRKSAD